MPQLENRNLRAAVIGAGAMGCLFGGLLTQSGADIWLLDVWPEHVRALNASGLHLTSAEGTRRIAVKATTDPADIAPVELAIVFVKAQQTEFAARTAAGLLQAGGLVLTLQNGLGNADTIAGILDAGRVAAGTTAQGATVLGPGQIRHAGAGPTVIGMWAQDDPAPAAGIAAALNAAGIDTTLAADIRRTVWDKLLVNVGINAITALTGIRNGQLLDLEVTCDLCRAAVQEAAAVARARGIDVRGDAAEHVLQVAWATAANRSSMGQDVDCGRQTEIDVINAVIVREARKAGLEAPVNQTLTALIETLQAHYKS